MSLTGTRVGTYEILSRLGAGGMGEVYRARDTKLGREVAIKVLPSSVAADPERLARFDREARSLAALNHPNIGAIYGVEEAAGIVALVLELVEGETLDARLKGSRSIAREGVGPRPEREGFSRAKGLALDDALAIARQIADALDAAHDRGIVHRDLKPANIVITPEGIVKVLDFGLAKGSGGSGGEDGLTHSPTMLGGTGEGVLLGTAPYMSPEQARGKTVDKRTDIWAFGCVLFEMLTGRRAFPGETTSDAIAAILEREPDWTALPAATPPHIRRLLARCLDKDPKRRLRDIGDARLELDPSGAQEAAPFSPRRSTRSLVAAGLVVFAAFGVLLSLLLRPSLALTPAWGRDVVTLSMNMPDGSTLGAGSSPVVSSDGHQVAWIATREGRRRIWSQPLASGVPRDLAGTDGASNPFWSPDGQSLGFVAQAQLKRVEVSTGSVNSIAVVPGVSPGGAWSPQNIIVFTARYALYAIPASGGTPKVVARLNRDQQENSLRYPHFLPDGRHFLYVARSGLPQKSGAYVGSLDGTSVRLFSTTSSVEYAAPGYLLYYREGALVARRFDPVTYALGPDTTTVAERVAINTGGLRAAFSASQNGVIALLKERTTVLSALHWYDRTGAPLGPFAQPGLYSYFRIAPDGRRVVVDIGDERIGGRSVWIFDPDGAAPVRLTFADSDDWIPVWAPDGGSIAFMSYRKGPGDIHVKSVATAQPEQALLESDEQKGPTDWSRDGRFLAYSVDRADSRQDVWVLPLQPPGTPIPIARTTFSERQARFSPDGKFIAYESDETGRFEVYVQPLPPTGAKWQVSANGGTDPAWRDGELLYADRDNMLIAVPVTTTGNMFAAGRPAGLFKLAFAGGAGAFDVTPDGRRLLVRVPGDLPAQSMTVILNWAAHLAK